eukprot:10934648-Alexandrium_andersonii.AAC.1
MAAALLGTVAVVQHQGDSDAGLVAVVHVRRDEASPTEGRLVIRHSVLPASPIEGLVVVDSQHAVAAVADRSVGDARLRTLLAARGGRQGP